MTEHQTADLDDEGFAGPWLVEASGEHGAHSAVLEAGQRLLIGYGRDANLRLGDPAVSRVHAELFSSAAGVSVEDRDSKNGVRIGSARVRRALLGHRGGAIVVGRTTVTVRRYAEGDDANPESIAGLIGSSPAMQRVRMAVRRYARVSANVLIQGESGVGKDVVARAIHRLSGCSGAYVPLNVGGLSAGLADAELFGHTRGAFTGAFTSRKGAFESAHHGTIFLDEIADMAPEIQVKLLRVLEERAVRPLGASQPLKVDARVLAASWASLEERVLEGSFRQDLYHRIVTISIAIPSLRERKSDIPELVEHLLRQLEPELGPVLLTPSALARLHDHDWPGNVRELRSVLYRAALSCGSGSIDQQDITEALPRPGRQKVSEVDISKLLAEHEGNVSRAARAARLPRSTLRDWIRRQGTVAPEIGPRFEGFGAL